MRCILPPDGSEAGGLVFPSAFPALASVRRLAALMFTDIAGYTPLAQADESGALRLL
jgi:class 3 adenylate cyclase